MRASRAVGLMIVIFAFSFLFGQEPKAGYFSLNSSRTYAPGQKVSIDMWAQNVETLEFRVYHVNDPVKFFVDLGDAHQFSKKDYAGRRGDCVDRLMNRSRTSCLIAAARAA